MVTSEETEPFPALSPINSESQPAGDTKAREDGKGVRRSSSTNRRTRGASLMHSFANSNPPLGMWQATGEVASKIPTLPEIHDGSFSKEGWTQEGQLERRGTNPHEIHRRTTRARRTSASSRVMNNIPSESADFELLPSRPTIQEEGPQQEKPDPALFASTLSPDHGTKALKMSVVASDIQISSHPGPDETGTYPNGYRFPKKHTWTQSIGIGLRAFWRFFCTPLGFAITIYGLNVVAWGAMIFFVLLEAAPAMCHPSCTAPYSARQIWIEIDSQILNALFCVTAFGLAPWRLRDTYYLWKWRFSKDQRYHRKLAGINRGWYRLPGSQHLPEHIAPPPAYKKKIVGSAELASPYSLEDIEELEANGALPLPVTSIPDPPLTGVRAQPSKSWTLDIVIYMYLLNTVLQCILAGCMWGLNRFTRPSWVTGLLISLGCVTGIVAGIVVFREGAKVKKAEGIPVQEYDVLESAEDFQQRMAKENEKQAKKDRRHPSTDQPRMERTEKIKGSRWFTRH